MKNPVLPVLMEGFFVFSTVEKICPRAIQTNVNIAPY